MSGVAVLFFLLFCAEGAFLYRLRGAPWLPFLHRPSKQLLYCLGPTFIAYMITGDWVLSIIAGAVSVASVCAGHGAYMDLGHTKNPENIDERPVGWVLRPLAKLIGIRPTTFAYDAIGLTLNGILMTASFAALFAWHGEWIAFLLAMIAGASKTLAYFIGWRWLMRYGATEVGEWLTGAFQWGLFAAAYLIAVQQ